jgi:hypothetical protein
VLCPTSTISLNPKGNQENLLAEVFQMPNIEKNPHTWEKFFKKLG